MRNFANLVPHAHACVLLLPADGRKHQPQPGRNLHHRPLCHVSPVYDHVFSFVAKYKPPTRRVLQYLGLAFTYDACRRIERIRLLRLSSHRSRLLKHLDIATFDLMPDFLYPSLAFHSASAFFSLRTAYTHARMLQVLLRLPRPVQGHRQRHRRAGRPGSKGRTRRRRNRALTRDELALHPLSIPRTVLIIP